MTSTHMTEQRQDQITQEQAMTSQSHPSHAAGGACWRGGRRVAVRRQEQLGVSSQGAKDLPQGLAEEIFASSDRTRRWTCLLRGTAQAREEHKTPTETGSTRHVDGRSIRACLRRGVPADHEAHSQTQRRQLRRVAQSFGGSAPRRPKQGKPNHDCIRTQTDHLTRMAT